METQKSIIETVHGLEGIEQKKHFLREFSQAYGMIVKNKGITVNELLRMAYEREGAINLKTFNQWKNEGFRVKKGAKSLILWSGVIINLEKKESHEGETKGGKFFKVAFVFDENNVESIN